MYLSDQDEIIRLFEDVYPENVRSRNLQGYADMYTEDAIWMAPGIPAQVGPDDILARFTDQIADQDIDPIFTAQEIQVMGNFGYVIGVSQATIHPKNGSAIKQVNFQALWLMKKEHNIWKIHRQIWNSTP
ncbi:MAG: SgcJ/EcaC family oxidoreductase [Cyanothece sp. SIO1E1]|nr:SgcJ/EcaC family oxidoreductase [Cyanothece sp. SIO1E1]